MNIETIKQRWSAPTPDFFKKAIARLLTIAVISTGISGALASMPFVLPSWVHAVLLGISSACIGMAKIAKLTVDADQLTEEQKDKLLQ